MATKKPTKTSTKRSGRPSKKSNPAGKQLVIVESPAKAQTINKYLGSDYVVMASVGHVRDLPDKNPKGIKDPVPGVDLENDFKPTYQIIKGKNKTIVALKKAAQKASGIWLATDLDREGEAIAWHVADTLGVKLKDSHRVVFNAITKGEIQRAFNNPRRLNMDKVNAQQARRILDRIVGYQVSPLLWKKVAGGLSAGRVQSVAVRLLVERERDIERFQPEEFWKLTGYFTTHLDQAPDLAEKWKRWLEEIPEEGKDRKSNTRTVSEKNAWLAEHESFAAELIEINGKKFESKNLESILKTAGRAGFQLIEKIETENPKGKGKAGHIIRLNGYLEDGPSWRVKSIETKRVKSRPNPPFITSTLQQAAANQLDFTAQATMRIAQNLYEGVSIGDMGSVGLITYMRTDSTHITNEAIDMARAFIESQMGKAYLPEKPNWYPSPNKKAQEAHEAIRPTDVSLTPARVRASLNDRQFKLYRLIWERFVGCQMTDAEWDSTTVLIAGANKIGGANKVGAADKKGEMVFRTSGRTLVFDGHYKVVGRPNTSKEAVLPPLEVEQGLAAIQLDPTQSFTSPPPRYTEASLVKKLEAEGIGRPSTYAQIIQVIQTRKYVEKIKNRFYATDLGKVVTDKLIEAFPEILEVGYTRDMEQQLDDVEEKQANWVQMLHTFYGPFKSCLEKAYDNMEHAKAETEPAPHTCPECGSATVYRFGRNGRFLSCARYPDCKFAAPIDRDGNPMIQQETDVACPKCGQPMLLRTGRFGKFLSCSKYPDCDGVVNLDKKGFVSPPKIPPLLTDLPCPTCKSPLNLRRGERGPWLSCSKFPKCRGRLGWASLDEVLKTKWEKALMEHEKAHPQAPIRKLDGTPVGGAYKPQIPNFDDVDDKES